MTKFDGQSDDQLKASIQECWDLLNAVLDKLNDRPGMQEGIRRRMKAENMVAELNAVAADSPELADLILQASVAALVNTQSVQANDAVLVRRANTRWHIMKIVTNKSAAGLSDRLRQRFRGLDLRETFRFVRLWPIDHR